MIQNLENKMELQINSLETRIKKMQKRFNKNLEEIKKSQYVMNNAINEIINTLEATNSRITEAEASCLQSFSASGSFPMSRFFASGGQRIGVSASASHVPCVSHALLHGFHTFCS